MIECDCGTGACGADGTCCSPTACPSPGAANDACGPSDLGCGQSCIRTCANDPQGNNDTCFNDKCCDPEPDNAAEWQTAHPGRCGFNISNGCGGVIDAPCAGGAACVDAASGSGTAITDPPGTTPSAIGYCCTDVFANCNATNACKAVPNACLAGAMVICSSALCPDGVDGISDEVCYAPPGEPLACCDPTTCPGPQPVGAACGFGSVDLGCGPGPNSSCHPDCANDAAGKANVCHLGTCCNPEPDDAAEWRTSHPGACAFNIDNGCGGRLDAPCQAGQVCESDGVQVSDVGSTFASGTCCTSADSCGGAAKDVGQACVVDDVCLNGTQTVTCPCAGGSVCFQNNCCAPAACPAGSGINGPCGSVDLGCGQSCTRQCSAGTCFQGSCCQPAACPAQSGLGGPCGQVDRGCGQSCTRQCSTGTCFQGTCCKPAACPKPAAIGGACGNVDLGCGQSCTVGCDTSQNKPNNTCVAGTCTCVPTPCPPGFSGSMQDGCGHIIACTGS
jgi:hypothetical protein